jgi:DNA-binding MarR family transcriptional regulator
MGEPGTAEGGEPGTAEGGEPGTAEGGEPGTAEGGEPGAAEVPRGDHVDHVRERWARERPDLDTSPFAVVGRLGRAQAYLDHGLAAFFAKRGLSRPAWDVLASLRRAGPPFRMSPTDLYTGLMRTSGTMTHRLKSLERAGLIERLPDERDGRSVLVALTKRGRELVDELAPEHLENERRLLSALTADEQGELASLLRKLLLRFEEELLVAPAPPVRRRRRRW